MTTTLPAEPVLAGRSQNLLTTIAQILGVDLTLARAPFRLTLTGMKEGLDVHAVFQPLKGGAAQIDRIIPAGNLVLPDTLGAIDSDVVSGTTTLVAGTKDVTIPGVGVPVGSTIYATVIANAGGIGVISAVRKDADEITISSTNVAETSTIRYIVVRP